MAAKKAPKNTAAKTAPASTPADTPTITTPEPAAAASPVDTVEEAAPAPPVETKAPEPKPAKAEKAAETVTEFVNKLLSKHLPPAAVNAWCAKVVDAVAADKIVTIINMKGQPVLEIHDDFKYQNRDSVRSLAARYGKNYQVNVNQLVKDKFPG